jgi:hypothetical protein
MLLEAVAVAVMLLEEGELVRLPLLPLLPPRQAT